MTFRRSFLVTFFSALLLAGAFAGGYLAKDLIEAHRSGFPVLFQAYSILANQGLKELPPAPGLEYGMIRGMVQAYDDPYTLFVEPPQHELETQSLQGSFGGIGVTLGHDAQGYWVLYPIPGGPAEEAKLEEGDRLLKVDNLDITPQTTSEVLESAIRGPVGRWVHLTVARPPSYGLVEARVKRAEIPIPSVVWHLQPGEPRLGILKVNLIAASTPEEIERAVKDLQSRGASHFVLDLRDNPGGLLTAGVDVARLFLREGVVIEQQYRGKPVEIQRVEKAGPLVDLPLAVLVNHASASAAEIVAGALKAHGRALVVGGPTYGKDTIQLVYDLEDGSSLHVTAAHWWVPGLQPPVGEGGLQPDIPVEPLGEGSSGPDPFILAAQQALLTP